MNRKMSKQQKKFSQRLAGLVLLSVLAMPWHVYAAGNSVVANNTLPEGGAWRFGGTEALVPSDDNIMNITQSQANAMISWTDFSIGANATVNFNYSGGGAFNILNYVTGDNASQLYGKMNATDGNVFLVNPNGIQIGNSAEINVGSLYLSNKKLDDWDDQSVWGADTDLAAKLRSSGTMTNAELMSLGYINAKKLTFEGQRVVLDLDRVSGIEGTATSSEAPITIISRESNAKDIDSFDVVLGMDATSDADSKWADKLGFINVDEPDTLIQGNSKANDGRSMALFYAYKWIKDGKELGRIGTDADYALDGDYALRYAIDLTGANQQPIGAALDAAFTGKFDGLNNNIFGLTIDTTDAGTAAGLFGYTDGAIIGNFNLIAGTDGVSITGKENVGSVIGYAKNTRLSNVISTLQVSGEKNVGGLVGHAVYKADANNAYAQSQYQNLINTGNVSGQENVGGIIGNMEGGTLGVGESATSEETVTHNLGRVSGVNTDSGTSAVYSSNVGGIVGYAKDAVIGGVKVADDGSYTNNKIGVYNALAVNGGYNVGGIVGKAEGTRLYNVSNEANITATGWTAEDYSFHTDYTGSSYSSGGTKTISVRMSNVGGIAGNLLEASEIHDATNEGNVSSNEVSGSGSWSNSSGDSYNAPSYFDHYDGGNVGGIVGRAENTNISDVTNLESNIRGSMNVGGIVGYYGTATGTGANKAVDTTGSVDYRITNATNDGGDIMGTGGILVSGNEFATEITRSDYNGDNKEKYIIGNIGGVVGSMEGIGAHLENSGNRGTVHTKEITSNAKIEDTAKAANIGGIVGNLDRAALTSYTDAQRLAIIKGEGNATDPGGKNGDASAVISNSYNSGEVKGFANIGGIVGFSYNGSLSKVDNYGTIGTTRTGATASYATTPINMGGIVGDTTEKTSARTVIYEAYNHGTLGDDSFTYYGRHVGGIVGRLSGIVEKAENEGAIYNGYNVVGGIAGYMYSGNLKNVFNTGNITVVNHNDAQSQVGGIVGSIDAGGADTSDGTTKNISITNAYNLGSLRSFSTTSSGANYLGGILGLGINWGGSGTSIFISNVYTTGNLYVNSGYVGAIYGGTGTDMSASTMNLKNAYYIAPTDTGYTNLSSAITNRSNAEAYSGSARVSVIGNADKYTKDKYSGFSFSTQTDGKVTVDDGTNIEDTWRIYEGSSTPILNAFLPYAEGYFSDSSNWDSFLGKTTDEAGNITYANAKGSVQYGTAYNPLMTIVKSSTEQTFDSEQLQLNNRSSFALYGIDGAKPALELQNFNIKNGNGNFIGTLYSDGNLFLTNFNGGISLGEGSELYGNGVYVYAQDTINANGIIISTGTDSTDETAGNIGIVGGEVNVYGKLTAVGKGDSISISGQGDKNSMAEVKDVDANGNSTVSDYNQKMISISERFTKTLDYSTYTDDEGNEVKGAARDGDLIFRTGTYADEQLEITTNGSGDINLLYGNLGTGKLTAKGEGVLLAQGSGNILVDSDLSIDGNVELVSDDLENGEVILDISNIGKQDNNGKLNAKAVHEFLNNHKMVDWETLDMYSTLTLEGSKVKIAVDAWDADYELQGVKGNYNYEQYDYNGESLKDALEGMSIYAGEGSSTTMGNAMTYAYTWVSSAEELDGIQKYVDRSGRYAADFLDYKFALKDNIDASTITDFSSIGVRDEQGSEGAFTGTFDGRGLRISGLTADNGLFSDLGKKTTTEMSWGESEEVVHYGMVEDLKIYSSTFTATASNSNVGAVAGKNSQGTITGYTGLGNTIIGTTDGYTGGVVGYNQNTVVDSQDQSTVIANGSTAGGIAGYAGTDAVMNNLSTNSAVTSINGTSSSVGGIAGVNYGRISNVSAHGVTGKEGLTSAAGGIVGENHGRIRQAYNESILHGSEGIGGIVGVNSTIEDDERTESALDKNGNPVYVVKADNTTRVSTTDSNGKQIYLDANKNKVYYRDENGEVIYINSDTGKRLYQYDDEGNKIKIVETDEGTVTRVKDYDQNGYVFLTEEGTRVSLKWDNDGVYYVDAAGNKYEESVVSEGYVDAAGNYYLADDVDDGVVDSDGIYYDFWNINSELGYINAAGEITPQSDVQNGGVDGYGNYYFESELETIQVAVSGRITDVVNALDIKGDEGSSRNIGGLVGDMMSGTLETGRNTGAISGTTNVGGLVGKNGDAATNGDSELRDLENAPQASITGVTNVGGIAGCNEGSIIVDINSLNNHGRISGVTNVGGVTGENTETGLVKNVGSSMELYINEDALKELQQTDTNAKAQYFGGVVGKNSGKVINANNLGDINAEGADYVGGIIGWNTEDGSFVDEAGLASQIYANYGNVIGSNYVGGIIGLNEAKTIDRIYAENTGTVTATAGGAGGIFGEYKGEISNSILVNAGMVIGSVNAGTDSGTGGIIGVNEGAITGSSLVNSALIAGGTNVGGVIGINNGSITKSDVVNQLEGEVIGVKNVGSLVGSNNGTLAGSRDENDNYYAYHVYNNGCVKTGTYTKAEGAEAYSFTATAGENVGGLVGTNGAQGSLALAYNTGAIDATGSTNVGGVVGNNAGTVDQVFNTITVRSGAEESGYSWNEGVVSGGTNVGGVVGTNSGNLTNAYNTTSVSGTTSTGAVAGTNSGTITNVYDSKATAGQALVADGTAAQNGYQLAAAGDDAKKKVSYDGFDFTGSESAAAVWKIYEGNSNALLKNFLTKVGYDKTKDTQQFTYDGTSQKKDVAKLISDGALSDLSNIKFAAYENSATKLINNDSRENINAGTHTDLLWSLQIGTNGADGDPNNLGYDLVDLEDGLKYDIDRAELKITLDDVYRTYGEATMYDAAKENADRKLLNDYTGSYTVSGWVGEEATSGKGALDKALTVSDGAVTVSGGKTTENVGTYDWSASFSGFDTNDILKNYTIKGATGENGTLTVSGTENSHVEKAALTIDLSDVSRTYGDTALTNNTSYGVKDGYTLVNGDSGTITINGDVPATKDGGLVTKNGELRTNNAGTYSWTTSADTLTGVTDLQTNYDIKITEGVSTVNKKKVSLNEPVASIVYGSKDGISANDVSLADGWRAYDDDELGVSGTVTIIENSSYEQNRNGRDTADVNENYKDSVNIKDATLIGASKDNYELDNSAVTGGIAVTKAELKITLSDVSRTYGDTALTNNTSYGVTADGLVNGDSGLQLAENAAKTDGALTTDGKTNDAGSYKWSIENDALTGVENLEKNYKVTIAEGNSTVDKAKLTIKLDNVERTYGSKELDEGSSYGFTVDGFVYNEDGLKDKLSLDNSSIKDGSKADDTTSGAVTKDVGEYEWIANITSDKDALKNYTFENEDGSQNVTAGKASVDKAKLTIDLSDVSRTYGSTDLTNGTRYKVANDVESQLQNGDKGFSNNDDLTDAVASDGALVGDKTNNAGSYKWTIDTAKTSLKDLEANYDITINDGNSTVDRAKLTLIVEDKTINAGDKPSSDDFSGSFDGLQYDETPDKIGFSGYELDSSINTDNSGTYTDKIGVIIDGKVIFTDTELKNYELELKPGTLTVVERQPEPTPGPVPSFDPANDYWLHSAPWDKQRHLRERKAVLNFIKGGVKL